MPSWMIRISRGLAALVFAAVPACEFDPSGQSSTSAATVASTAPNTDDSSGPGAQTSTEDDDGGSSSSGESDGSDGCVPGNVGCACDAGACLDVLSCMGNVCVVPSCPNAI